MNRRFPNEPFIVLMKTAKGIHEKIREQMLKSNLNVTEFSVLEVLYQKGTLTIQQICQNVLISSGSMTYVIDKLEKRGLLKRSACPNDRRAIHVSITDEGLNIMDMIMPKYLDMVDGLFEVLNPEEAETFLKLLKKVNNTVE
ncbi:MarR family transcriptional regulator [Neobacillus piezotolerans]|uniref:MarR family transcriptional regulator n=1 Tax=Neobacillus piezotolerans TaxID=2259171 RepID=A0A3D8GTB1_9BACI|nr:MarR family transcriptional regulator [Neobacillus piezotolerans]RDU37704.1 MarR family transcriptional regulator [Neobacillus piezotolerans]